VRGEVQRGWMPRRIRRRTMRARLLGVKQQQGGRGGGCKARRVAYLPRYFVEFLLREAAEKALVVAFVRDDVG
jgi:hypothetical protein